MTRCGKGNRIFEFYKGEEECIMQTVIQKGVDTYMEMLHMHSPTLGGRDDSYLHDLNRRRSSSVPSCHVTIYTDSYTVCGRGYIVCVCVGGLYSVCVCGWVI